MKQKFLFILLSIFGVFIFNINIVKAASLFFSPASKSVTAGNIVEVGVYVNTADQAINNVEGTVVFPTDLLEVVNVSKSSSIFSLWVEEPSFSNSTGKVNFNGGLPTPGYKGSGGRVLNIIFRAKASGQATLYFSGSAIRANDGLGTNIYTGSGNANIAIDSGVSDTPTPSDNQDNQTPTPETETTSGLPSAPQISSDTHPNSDSWYNNNKALFTWRLGTGVNAVQLLVGNKPNVVPTVTYSPAISDRQLDPLEDGIWYFHVRLRNAKGWGPTSHYRFQIDTKNPDLFNMTVLDSADKTSPSRTLNFESFDATSGISHYEIQIDDGKPKKWIDDGSHRYTTDPLSPGRHVIIARAVDKAGNFLSNFSEFFIDSLKAPIITDYPKEISAGNIFAARGQSYSNAKVVVWLERDGEEAKSSTVTTDQNGFFTYVADKKLSDGLYRLWTEALDERGAKSGPSEKLSIMVQPGSMVRAGSWVITMLSVMIPALALIFMFIFLWYFGLRKTRTLHRRLNKEVGEAEVSLHNEFSNLRRNIKTHLKILEKASRKRKLTKEENDLLKKLSHDLDDAEKSVAKEIKDIRKQI